MGAGLGWLSDPLATKFASQCLYVSALISFSVVYQSILLFNLPRGWYIIENVIHPISAMFLGSGLNEVLLEMSTIP